jgi:hypothetical protein
MNAGADFVVLGLREAVTVSDTADFVPVCPYGLTVIFR